MSEVLNTLIDRFPWLIVVVVFLLILFIISILGIIFYAAATGRRLNLWKIEIGPKEKSSKQKHLGKDGLNLSHNELAPDLINLLVHIKKETVNRKCVFLKEFEQAGFPNFSYWMLECLVLQRFLIKEKIGQSGSYPDYSYRLSKEYKNSPDFDNLDK